MFTSVAFTVELLGILKLDFGLPIWVWAGMLFITAVFTAWTLRILSRMSKNGRLTLQRRNPAYWAVPIAVGGFFVIWILGSSISGLNNFLSGEKMPPSVKVGDVRFIQFSPMSFNANVYVRGEIRGVEAERKSKQRFRPDATARAKIRDGRAITFDTIIGYNASEKGAQYSVQDGGKVTLTIDTSKIFSVQTRVIPFENDDKIQCNDDRMRRWGWETGDCAYLAQRFGSVSLVGAQTCLGTTWPVVKQAIVRAEQERLRVMYEHYKQLRPGEPWQIPELEVVFEPDVPTNLEIVPDGWTRTEKDGQPVIQRQVQSGGKKTTETIYIDRLDCKVDEDALKSEFYDPAGGTNGLR